MSAVDLVIPVYNEGGNILAVMESLKANVKTPVRILICYDHDGDDTLEAMKKYAGPFEVVYVKNRKKGVHGAVMTGLEESRADAVIVMPADDTYNGALIDKMFEKFKGGCDIVAPSRFVRGGCMKRCPLMKGLFVRISSFTLRHLGRLPIHDATNGFRLFSKRLLETVSVESTEGFTFSIELAAKCHRLGWKMEEVPALWFERTKGRSRFNTYGWLAAYLHWYRYIFATTYLRPGPQTVRAGAGSVGA